jgi:biopolymer transport protein ExbB/TolQ
MRRLLGIGILIASVSFSTFGANKKETLNLELERLKEMVQSSRDSLEREIAARYSFKQHTVEQRQFDEEDFSQWREKQEKAINDLSKGKEEVLVREQNLSEVKKTAADKEDEWNIVKNSIQELLQKDAATLIEGFPIGRETRQADLEGVRRNYQLNKNPSDAWDAFVQYKTNYLSLSRIISVKQESVLPNDAAVRMCSVARFGNVFAYCQDTGKVVYIIRQTGRLGADRYTIESVGSKILLDFLLIAMPKWTQDGAVSGEVMADVMQNDQSQMLVSGLEKGGFAKFYEELHAGGAIMIPLLLLPVWALWLIFGKFFQIANRRRQYKRVMAAAMAMINKNELEKAMTYVKSQKGLMARVIEVCLDPHRRRAAVENSVRNLISQEIPVLNRNLNTLAVIAGAAPLTGLLGTISGMITLFAAVTHYGTGDPKFLAGGISEALITAKTGLAVAIPVLLIHDVLRNWKDNIVADIELMSITILEKLKPEN